MATTDQLTTWLAQAEQAEFELGDRQPRCLCLEQQRPVGDLYTGGSAQPAVLHCFSSATARAFNCQADAADHLDRLAQLEAGAWPLDIWAHYRRRVDAIDSGKNG